MEKNLARISRTVLNLREMLFDEIEALQEGRSSSDRAHAVARLAAQIILAAKLEVMHGKQLQKAIEQETKVVLAKRR
jgi:hypothetical protein